MEKYLDVKDVSGYLKCSVSFIRKMIYERKIPFFKIGNRILFRLSRIEEWISENEKTILL